MDALGSITKGTRFELGGRAVTMSMVGNGVRLSDGKVVVAVLISGEESLGLAVVVPPAGWSGKLQARTASKMEKAMSMKRYMRISISTSSQRRLSTG